MFIAWFRPNNSYRHRFISLLSRAKLTFVMIVMMHKQRSWRVSLVALMTDKNAREEGLILKHGIDKNPNRPIAFPSEKTRCPSREESAVIHPDFTERPFQMCHTLHLFSFYYPSLFWFAFKTGKLWWTDRKLSEESFSESKFLRVCLCTTKLLEKVQKLSFMCLMKAQSSGAQDKKDPR